jgi:Rad3-related DNA helicase
LNAEDADELVVGSPFDYEKSALVYVATDIPEPSDYNGHQRAVETAIASVAKASGGRMLALVYLVCPTAAHIQQAFPDPGSRGYPNL